MMPRELRYTFIFLLFGSDYKLAIACQKAISYDAFMAV